MSLPAWLRPFELPDEIWTRLGGVLTEQTRDLEQVHHQMFLNCRRHETWYQAEPKVRRKSFPFEGAANVVVPVIRTSVDASTSRQFALIQSQRRTFWTGHAHNQDFADKYLSNVLSFLNWAARNEFDSFWSVLDWIHENNILGTSVMAVTWEEDERYIMLPKGGKPVRVARRRGPKWQHWPAEKILWEPGQSVRDADTVLTQSLVPFGELARLAQTERGYRQDAVIATESFPHFHGSPGADIQAFKEERAGVDPDLNISRRKTYDKRVAWIDWPDIKRLGMQSLEDRMTVREEVSGKLVRVPIIVEFCPDSKMAFRAMPNPYICSDGNPFFDIYFRKQTGYPRGVGLAKIGEAVQRAISTMVNQALDAVTLANAMPYATTNPRFQNKPITPGLGVWVDNIEDIRPLEFQKAIMPEISMVNLLQTYHERSSGVNDPLIGRESRSGGHPSPATNYLGMLQQSAEMGSIPVRMIRERLSRMGEYTATLYQLFDTDKDGRIDRVFGQADSTKIKSWLFPTEQTIPGNCEFDMYALSETESPQAQQQQSIQTFQVTGAYAAQAIRLAQALESPQMGPLAKKACMGALEALGRTYQQFLEASNFDDARDLIVQLQQGNVNNADALNQFTQVLSGLQPQPGPGGPPNGGAGPPTVAGPGAAPPPDAGGAGQGIPGPFGGLQ